MTVKQLIEKLKEFDENKICYEAEYGYSNNIINGDQEDDEEDSEVDKLIKFINKTNQKSFENFTREDIEVNSLIKAYTDIKKFLQISGDHVQEAIEDNGLERLGMDIWYTRNHHGAGFFDHSYDYDTEKALIAAGQSLGEVDLYINDNLKLSFSNEHIDESLNESVTQDNTNMVFWHGGDLTNIDYDYRGKTGKQEYGPGLYLTTSYDVVKNYIKGNRKLYKVTVSSGNDIDNVILNYDVVKQFLGTLPKPIRILLDSVFQKHVVDNTIKAYIINNCFVNYNLLKPAISQKLRQFYLDNNIDYNIVDNVFGWGEKQMVLFNTNKIEYIERMTGKFDMVDLHEKIEESFEQRKKKFNQINNNNIILPLNTEFYHGTIENYDKRNVRGGGYDKIFWCADSPSIAQTYISRGGRILLTTDSLLNPSKNITIQNFQKRIGIYYDYDQIKWNGNQYSNITIPSIFKKYYDLKFSFSDKGSELYQQIQDIKIKLKNIVDETEEDRLLDLFSKYEEEYKDNLNKIHQIDSKITRIKRKYVNSKLESMGYSPDRELYDLDFSWALYTDKNDIVAKNYRPDGRLFIVTLKRDMKFFDMTNAGDVEGDLMDLDYNKLDTFTKIEASGYDGVKINDFAQSDNLGNYGHWSYGFFKNTLNDLNIKEIKAVHQDIDINSDDEDITPEYKNYMNTINEGFDDFVQMDNFILDFPQTPSNDIENPNTVNLIKLDKLFKKSISLLNYCITDFRNDMLIYSVSTANGVNTIAIDNKKHQGGTLLMIVKKTVNGQEQKSGGIFSISEIMRWIIEFFKDSTRILHNMNESRVVNGTYRYPNPPNESPIKDDEVIRVYHGFYSFNNAIYTIYYGLSGKEMAKRIYSYEYGNNPKGLFVSIDMKQVTRQFAGSGVIIEFNTKVSDLEAPVWVGGRGYFVQGEYTKSFNSDEEREDQRLQNREREKNNDDEKIRNSDRPELGATLFGAENQALFIGDLNPNMIRAVWYNEQKNKENKTGEWKRYSRKDFLRLIGKENVMKLINDNGYGDRASNKIFSPADEFSDETVRNWFKKQDYDYNSFLRMAENPKQFYHVEYLFWPKQLEAAKQYYQKNELTAINEAFDSYEIKDQNDIDYIRNTFKSREYITPAKIQPSRLYKMFLTNLTFLSDISFQISNTSLKFTFYSKDNQIDTLTIYTDYIKDKKFKVNITTVDKSGNEIHNETEFYELPKIVEWLRHFYRYSTKKFSNQN